MPSILVDTWFWVAANFERDQNHDLAIAANEELLDQGYVYVTTNFVLAEAYTLLRRWVGAHRAIAFGREIREAVDAQAMELVYATPEIERDAWAIFEQYEDVRDLSYVDCTTFVAMRDASIHEALTNDKHFQTMGFLTKP